MIMIVERSTRDERPLRGGQPIPSLFLRQTIVVARGVAEAVPRVAIDVVLDHGLQHLLLVHLPPPTAFQGADQNGAVLRVDQESRPRLDRAGREVVYGFETYRQPVVGLDLDLIVFLEHVDDRALIGLRAVVGRRVGRDDHAGLREPQAEIGLEALFYETRSPHALLDQLTEHEETAPEVHLREDERGAGHAGIEADDERDERVELERLESDMPRGLEAGDHRLAGRREAPLGVDELLAPGVGLTLGQIHVVVPAAGEVVQVLSAGREPARLEEIGYDARVYGLLETRGQEPGLALVRSLPGSSGVMGDLRRLIEILVPPAVLRVGVAGAPDAPVGRPAVLLAGVTPYTSRESLDDRARYLHELVYDREGDFKGEDPLHIVGRVQRAKHHLALDIIEPEDEILRSGQPLAGFTILEPEVPGLDRGVYELRGGIAHDYGRCPAHAVPAGNLLPGQPDELEEVGRGLAGAEGPYDPRVEEPGWHVMPDESLDGLRRSIGYYVGQGVRKLFTMEDNLSWAMGPFGTLDMPFLACRTLFALASTRAFSAGDLLATRALALAA